MALASGRCFCRCITFLIAQLCDKLCRLEVATAYQHCLQLMSTHHCRLCLCCCCYWLLLLLLHVACTSLHAQYHIIQQWQQEDEPILLSAPPPAAAAAAPSGVQPQESNEPQEQLPTAGIIKFAPSSKCTNCIAHCQNCLIPAGQLWCPSYTAMIVLAPAMLSCLFCPGLHCPSCITPSACCDVLACHFRAAAL